MRAVLQRVHQASVTVDKKIVGQIQQGLLVYLGIGKNDQKSDVEYMVDKLTHLRLFSDPQDKMNLSVQDIDASILLISQFTLYGDCRKGRRPGFDPAAPPELAQKLYEYAIELLRKTDVPVQTGIFAAHMDVNSINNGPVTFLLDSSRTF